MTQPLIIILAYQCNLNCSYCAVFKRNNFIRRKTAFKAVDLYLNSLVQTQGRIKIFGGEPLLKISLLKELISYIRKQNTEIEIELTTNGLFLEDTTLNWFRNQKINLSLSLDGDEKTQLLNRIGTCSFSYRKILRLVKKLPTKVIINMVIAPNTVDRFFQNFLYLHNLGIKRFNFLPASYLFWNQKQLKTLENQLSLISFYTQSHPEIYFKNLEIDNDLFFFNTGWVVDTNGDIFFTNAIMVKKLNEQRKGLKIGNIEDLDIIEHLRQLNNQREIEKIKSVIEKSFPAELLKSNQALNSLLDNFVNSIKNQAPNNKRVDIKIGYQCNNHCLFCVQGEKRKSCAFRDKNEIKKDLIEARKSCDSIVFTGGESTIHPSFLDLVRLAKRLNFKTIQIQTNCRMFAYKKFCQETIKAGANEFSPALHGHTAKLHDFLTTVPGSFEQTIQGIKNLKMFGQRIITNTVINKFNYRHLPRIAKLLVSLKVDQFQLAFVHIIGAARENRNFIVPQKSQIMPFVKRGLDIGIKAGIKVMTEAIPYCFMLGYEQYIAERIMPEAMVIENQFKIRDYKEYRINLGKMKGSCCSGCLYFSICEGPWREYPEIFGWEEFKSVTKI